MRIRALRDLKDPECTSVRQVEDKCEIMRAEHPEYWDTVGEGAHAKRSTVTIQSVLGDKLQTSLQSCGQRKVGDKPEFRDQMGDKWETSACGPKHSEHPECAGRRVGGKPEIMRAENPV